MAKDRIAIDGTGHRLAPGASAFDAEREFSVAERREPPGKFCTFHSPRPGEFQGQVALLLAVRDRPQTSSELRNLNCNQPC